MDQNNAHEVAQPVFICCLYSDFTQMYMAVLETDPNSSKDTS